LRDQSKIAYASVGDYSPEEDDMLASTAPRLLTCGEVATRIGVKDWQIRKLFSRGLLPTPARLGLNRIIAEDDLPAVREALARGGYLSDLPTAG
jgi:predicted DNA-binding transcriptional regulator AlpA